MVNNMRAFGTEEYGNSDGFNTICNKCGREAQIVPTHHYKEVGKLKKITLNLDVFVETNTEQLFMSKYLFPWEVWNDIYS